MRSPDRPLLGIALMSGFCVLAPLGDALAKLLGAQLSIGMLVLVRFAIQAALLIPLGIALGLPRSVPRDILPLVALRTLLHIIGISAMFLSLRYLPLADAVAIAFVMPFIMLLLGRFVLNEVVGPHRIAACAVGFAGTLLVVQPNFASVGAPALLPLLVAVVFALFILVTRQIAHRCDPITLQAVSGVMAIAVLGPAVVLLPWQELRGGLPLGAVPLLLALGLLGTFAHLMMTWSLRFAPSATLAPMQYLEIPFATAFGWLIFRDLPNGLASLGIAVTVSAGLYIIMRERSLSRRIVLTAQASGDDTPAAH